MRKTLSLAQKKGERSLAQSAPDDPFQLERMFTNNVLVNNLVSCHFVMFFFFKASHVLYVEISFQLKRISVKTHNQITKREKKN